MTVNGIKAENTELRQEVARLDEALAFFRRRSADLASEKADDRVQYSKLRDVCRAQEEAIIRLTAEVAEYEATFDAAWEADMRGVQMWREAHPGNDMVLPDRANFTSWILAEIVIQRAENKKLRAALYDCLEMTAKHHAEDQARAQIGGSDMAMRKAKAILTRSSLLFGKIRTIVNAALEGKQ